MNILIPRPESAAKVACCLSEPLGLATAGFLAQSFQPSASRVIQYFHPLLLLSSFLCSFCLDCGSFMEFLSHLCPCRYLSARPVGKHRLGCQTPQTLEVFFPGTQPAIVGKESWLCPRAALTVILLSPQRAGALPEQAPVLLCTGSGRHGTSIMAGDPNMLAALSSVAQLVGLGPAE